MQPLEICRDTIQMRLQEFSSTDHRHPWERRIITQRRYNDFQAAVPMERSARLGIMLSVLQFIQTQRQLKPSKRRIDISIVSEYMRTLLHAFQVTAKERSMSLDVLQTIAW